MCSSRRESFANDNTMIRQSRNSRCAARSSARVPVGGGVARPGVEIGEEAFIAAGAVVTRDIGEREVVMGVRRG